jgi:hypothetical protein
VFEENRILSINKLLLAGVVDLMKKFVPIFDSLEFSQSPTLNNVVPSYYKMKRLVSPADQDRPTLVTLKREIDLALEEKYVKFYFGICDVDQKVNYTLLLILASPCRYSQSIMPIHWLATYLEPSFRELAFVKDRQLRCKQQKVIQEGLMTMLEDIEINVDVNSNASDQVCKITTKVIYLILTFRVILVCRPQKDAKTTTKVLTRLLTYGVKFRSSTVKRRKRRH